MRLNHTNTELYLCKLTFIKCTVDCHIVLKLCTLPKYIIYVKRSSYSKSKMLQLIKKKM